MSAEEEFEEYINHHPSFLEEEPPDLANVIIARRKYKLWLCYLHQQERIDEWKRSWQLEMAHSSKCEEKIRELGDEINGLKEGINAALSYNLPYLAEKALKEFLKEQS